MLKTVASLEIFRNQFWRREFVAIKQNLEELQYWNIERALDGNLKTMIAAISPLLFLWLLFGFPEGVPTNDVPIIFQDPGFFISHGVLDNYFYS